MNDKTPWPEEIRLSKDKQELKIAFNDGTEFEFSAEFLRVLSPSAEVQGHTPDQRQTVPKKQNVLISNIEPVGNYAIRIIFDDGHDTGLYSWDYLHELGENRQERWAGYLQDLSDKGLTRS